MRRALVVLAGTTSVVVPEAAGWVVGFVDVGLRIVVDPLLVACCLLVSAFQSSFSGPATGRGLKV